MIMNTVAMEGAAVVEVEDMEEEEEGAEGVAEVAEEADVRQEPMKEILLVTVRM